MPDAAHLFISDLHLDASAPAAVEQFLQFLSAEAARARSLYILGDLFEAWVGDDDEEPARQRVCEALMRLTRGGVPCFVVRGNRDFLFGAGFEARTGCQLLPDPLLATFGEQQIFVSHGDVLCTDDHSYQELRSIVRNPQWQGRFLALPLAARRIVADAARAGSKAHTQNVQRAIMDVNPQAVVTAFRVSGTRLMIHGHTHRPGIFQHDVDGELGTRIVLGDWYEQGSVLIYRDGDHYELRTLKR